MKKRIFKQMVLLSSFGILLVALILSGFYYKQMSGQIREDLKERTRIFIKDDSESALENLSLVEAQDMRITIVSPQGSVLYDNMVDPSQWKDHFGREEIEQAFLSGQGESRRISSTLGQDTYYFTIRLTDGAVLRTAKTVKSIGRMFVSVLPLPVGVILLTIFLGLFASRSLAKRIVEPIGELDFSGEPRVPYDELVPLAKTITDQRRQIELRSKELRERNHTIEIIMDSMSEGVVLLDKKGKILSVNKSAQDIFGAQESLIGHSPLELFRNLKFNEHIKRGLENQRGEMTFNKEGRQYRVLFSPVSRKGVVVLLMDMTEKFRADKMRREFSANVSHELRTPLTSIYGNAEMLKAAIVKEEDKPEFYSKIMEEASRLIDLVEDIMMLSELDEGKISQAYEDIDLDKLASKAAQGLSQKAREYSVELRVNGTAKLQGVPALIFEMFYNLIDNGIKYNKPGGTVDIILSQTEQAVHITAIDTGIGISSDDQQRIFERFHRVDQSRSTASGDTGLGLAIVKHIVTVHGGSISVESHEGQGASFVITFTKRQSV